MPYQLPAINKTKPYQGEVREAPDVNVGYGDVTAQDPNWAAGLPQASTLPQGGAPIQPTVPAPKTAPKTDPVQDVYKNTTPGGAPVPSGISSVAPGLFDAPTPTTMQTAGRDALLKMMEDSQRTPSLDDPTLKPQVDVFRTAQQRSAERQRASAAERLAFQGLASGGAGGALDSAIGQIEAGRGLNEANFEANLIGGEMSARRQQLQRGIEIATSLGDAEAARELNTRLALLDATLGREGTQGSLGLQRELGMGDLDLRRFGITQQGQLGKLQALLQLYGMNLNNDQFNTQQGFNWTNLGALMNLRQLELLMGGG